MASFPAQLIQVSLDFKGQMLSSNKCVCIDISVFLTSGFNREFHSSLGGGMPLMSQTFSFCPKDNLADCEAGCWLYYDTTWETIDMNYAVESS